MSLFGFLFILSCGSKNDAPPSQSAENKQAVSVKVASITETMIGEEVKITGEIAPLYRVDVYSKVAGLVVSESVKLGQTVSKGQVLAEVQQDIPGMEFTPVKVEATTDGEIARDGVESGSRISPQQALYTIQNIQNVYMIGKVVEEYLNSVKPGSIIDVEVDAFPGKIFRGKISEIDPQVDTRTRMGEIRIIIENKNAGLKPGMFATAQLTIGQHRGLVAPLDAIVPLGANRYLFRVENGFANQVMVHTGTIMDDLVEVKGAVQAGDEVVVLGQNLLEDHTPVRLAEE